MSSVGAYLRELRQRRGVSLEEIARITRVAQRYLAAIEADAFETLPAPVFIRGFIRAYCQALGEPPEQALAVYDGRDGRQTQTPARPAPARAKDSEPRARGAILVSFVLLVVLGMALFSVALLIHPRDRAERPGVDVRPEPGAAPPPEVASRPIPVTPAPAAAPRATPPLSSERSAVSAPLPAMSPVAAAPQDAPIPLPASAASSSAPPPNLEGFSRETSPYRLVARTNELTWIRVRTDDGRVTEENVPAGEVREWVSDRPFVVTIGNAGGVSFELNGRSLPSLGAKGAVIPRLVLPPESR